MRTEWVVVYILDPRSLTINTEHQAIIEAALALPEAERVVLLERLLQDLSPPADEVPEETLAAELDSRRAAVEQGLEKPIPFSEPW